MKKVNLSSTPNYMECTEDAITECIKLADSTIDTEAYNFQLVLCLALIGFRKVEADYNLAIYDGASLILNGDVHLDITNADANNLLGHGFECSLDVNGNMSFRDKERVDNSYSTVPEKDSTVADSQCKCANCSHVCPQSELDTIDALAMRIDAGSEVPAGQCSKCGCLSYIDKASKSTISEAIAIWDTVLFNDIYYKSLDRMCGAGVWEMREYVASKILPAVNHYYSIHGEDVDYDGVFLPAIIKAMHERDWTMDWDYSDVCIEIARDWLSSEAEA